VRHRATVPEHGSARSFVNPGGPGVGGADHIPLVTAAVELRNASTS
jgi:hypothetical protein